MRGNESGESNGYANEIPELPGLDWRRGDFRCTPAQALETAISAYIQRQRWYGGKAKRLRALTIADAIPLQSRDLSANITLVRIEYVEGDPETYVLPLSLATSGQREGTQIPDGAIVARVPSEDGDRWLFDVALEPEFGRVLLDLMRQQRSVRAGKGGLIGSCSSSLREDEVAGAKNVSAPHAFEQSNTSILFDHQMIFKLFRRVSAGVNPDVEVGRFLTEQAHFPNTPEYLGTIEYRPARGELLSLGILQRFVTSEGDAWSLTLNSLTTYFERVLAAGGITGLPEPPEGVRAIMDLGTGTHLVQEFLGGYYQAAELLGVRTAEMHVALAAPASVADFTPVSFTPLYQRSLYESIHAEVQQSLMLLRQREAHLPPGPASRARRVIDGENRLLGRLSVLLDRPLSAIRTRTHGDYHLGQVLFTGTDFIVIDFEGEPARSIEERRTKQSPLRDVAGMLASFDYAQEAALRALRDGDAGNDAETDRLRMWARFWSGWVSTAFLHGYLGRVVGTPAWPAAEADMQPLLDVLLLEKAAYELRYELNSRPDWVGIPLGKLDRLASGGPLVT
jgi:maltose alpha-D-glucosyltransferase / alpha-amylase